MPQIVGDLFWLRVGGVVLRPLDEDLAVFFVAIFVIVHDGDDCHLHSSVLWVVYAMVVTAPLYKLVVLVKIADFKMLADLGAHVLFRIELKRQVRQSSPKPFQNLHIRIFHDIGNFHEEGLVRPLSLIHWQRAFIQGKIFTFDFKDF